MANGYSWSLNYKLPTIEDHSLAKHEVLRAYLVNYLRILAQNPNSEGIRVTLVDGFAGGGQYQTPAGSIVGGSPLILLSALKEARTLVALDRQQRNIRKPYVIHAHVHLVEKNADTCAYLRKVIAETSDASANNTTVSVYQSDFNQKLPDILTDIRSRQKRNGRSVFILDQYGWSQVNLEAVKLIFSELPFAEVFLTWMIDNLINFLSEKMVDKLNPALQRAGLGSTLTAEQLLAIKNGESDADGDLTWRRAIQSIMTDQIRSISGATFSTPFYIVPRTSRRGYWLLHLAQHLRANEEMKRIHWENNNLHHPGGPGFNMLGFIGNNGQLAFDNRFDEHANRVTLDALQNDIPRRISELRTPLLFGELVQLTANETPARLRQLQEAVFFLAQERELIVRTKAGSARRTAHGLAVDDTVELPTQLWLLPNSAR
jgi:three-Cys-motif partner protein